MRHKSRATLRRNIFCILLFSALLYIVQEPWNTLARRNNQNFCEQDFDLDTMDVSSDAAGLVQPTSLLMKTNQFPRGTETKCNGLAKHLPVVVSKPGNLDNWNADDFEQTDNLQLRNGSYVPTNCRPQQRVAIIVPLRGREGYLHHLLSHMHPIWQRQGMAYTVFVVTQMPDELKFNKAKIMNAGFKEAMKRR